MTGTPQPEPNDDEIKKIAMERVHQVHRTLAALMVESVEQLNYETGTEEHRQHTQEMRRLSDAALSEGVAARDVLFTACRANAVLIRELCKRLGIDPLSTTQGFEENYFLRSL